jgi:hypothetical protein
VYFDREFFKLLLLDDEFEIFGLFNVFIENLRLLEGV